MLIYTDEFVQVHHAEWQTVDIPVVDHILTDPPFGDSTHKKALTLRERGVTNEISSTIGKKRGGRSVDRRGIEFASLSRGQFVQMVMHFGSLVRRWMVMTCERRYVETLEQKCEHRHSPISFIREGIYHKPNGMPNLSGDRPSSGYWEPLIFLHRRRNGRMRWNGGGKSSVYTFNKPATAVKHPTQKSLPFYLQLVQDISDPGELILDPFGGSGQVAMACKILQRRCIIIERDKKYADLIVRNVKATQAMPLSLLPEPIQEVLIV